VLAKATADKAAQGQKIYEAQQCSRCHSIAGVGSPRGRALDKVGATRQGEWLVEHFRNPSAMTPNSRMPPVNLSDDDMAALTAYMLSLK
jgi:nitric oxide reductase subunit C